MAALTPVAHPPLWWSKWRDVWREHPLRSTLGKRLLAWFLVLSLVPLIGSNAVGYLVSGRIINTLAERDLRALTEVQAHHLRDELERRLVGLASAAASNRLLVASAATLLDPRATPAGLSAASALATEELVRLRQEFPEFGSLVLLGRGGMVVSSAPPVGAGVRWSDRALAARARAAGRALSVGRAGVPVEPRLSFAVAVPTGGDSVAFVVVGTVPAGAIGDLFQIQSWLAGGVLAFIVDDAGLPVFASRAGAPIDYARPLPLHTALRRGQRRPALEGQGEVIAAAHAVPSFPLVLVTAVPVRAALGGLRWLRTLSIVLEATFVLVLVGVVWNVARGIVRPVHDLVAATERIGRGDLDASVHVPQIDELGQLAQRFNDMATQLRESAARVHDLHQQQMQRAEQLATVGELAAGVAHELKTPLLGIASGTRLLARRLGPEDVEGQRLAQELLQRADRMEAAVQALLSYARPAPARRSLLDLNAVVERALQLVVPRAQQAGVELRSALAAGLPRLRLDPDQVGQIVVNLTLNAVEAMAAGGSLLVATRPAGDHVDLEVSDSGPGIAPEERERVFRPFYTTKHRGTGLGLAIVRQIVEQHGGTIRVDGAPGGGARFAVSLPIHEPAGGGIA